MSAAEVAALSQEILALTDFGRQPDPDLSIEERQYLERALPFFALSYTLLTVPEIVGDVLTSMNFLGMTQSYGYNEALRVMLSRQNKDGSFGALLSGRADLSSLLAPTNSCLTALSAEARRRLGAR